MYGGANRHNHHPHHHYPNAHHKGGPPPGAVAATTPESAKATDIFELFISASTFKSVLHHHRQICELLKLRPTNYRQFYPKLKSNIRSWKAQALWSKYDKRASHKCYNQGKACENSKVLIIGAGPCGLRSAIEAQLLGAKVVVIEKRDRFSRNNVLHLWPFVISDLRALGAKKFYGKFCAGAIDHISIRQLQCILLKVALLLGVEVIEAVTFEELLEPPEDQSERIGWHARFSPAGHPVNQYEFGVLLGADGKRNTLLGFKRKEFRGKLAIAITANFINKHSEQEARVQEISGVAFIFNQKFFKDLYAETGIDLENIVYYKDETHYFVMTAKKHSLIDKGVILNDYSDTQQLLHPNNVDREALCDYAREAADFSTNGLLPHMDFAVNHYGKPDIAMFDFTSMFQADNACRVIESHGHKLLQCLVGDSLLEPFWPTGSGCPRGFLSSFDACWAIRSWASGKMSPLEVIAERESTYRLLAQTTPENLGKDATSYTLEPSSRYPTVNLRAVLPFQVRHLFVTDDPDSIDAENNLQDENTNPEESQRKRKRRDSIIHPDTLLSWVQKQAEVYPELEVIDMTSSFKDGRVFCAIIHRYCPNLLDIESLVAQDGTENCQLAFDILEKDFGIPPVMTGIELANCDTPDKLTMMSYISQIYDVFRGKIPQFMGSKSSFTQESLDLGDFPATEEVQFKDESSSLSTQSSILRCRIADGASFDSVSKNNTHQTKRRKNELGSSDKLDSDGVNHYTGRAKKITDSSEPFSDRVKDLEAKFRNGAPSQQKPKDMIRTIGKLEKTDWNLAAIEKKIEDNVKPQSGLSEKERVPRWSRDLYNDKYHNFERRLRENGEDEDRIAKYLDIDASLKKLEMKLKEGSTLETGLRGHNKVSNLANQLSSKFVKNEEDKCLGSRQTKPVVLQTGASDMCHFCNARVYFVEKLSAEGKFFHRKCFKCSFCGVLLKLGNYVYDREGRYGYKFFCIPHLGMTNKAKKNEDIDVDKENHQHPFMAYHDRKSAPPAKRNNDIPSKVERSELREPVPLHLTPPAHLNVLEDRGTTPERAEFENSLVEQSDEEEYLSEDEWTDRNFGASANELDESDDDSDYSDLGSNEEPEIDDFEEDHKFTVDETRRLAESWKRRYSTDALDHEDGSDDSEIELDSDHFSEEHGADGDESHTATEGEGGDEEEDEDDGEPIRKARELRRQELDINFDAPWAAETSDSGSETEVPSDEESDTQIDTDSEFAEDQTPPRPPKEIPTIVIEESLDSSRVQEVAVECPKEVSAEPKEEFIQQKISLDDREQRPAEGTEKSASLSNLINYNNTPKVEAKNPHTEQLQRLLQRTESTEAVSARNNLQLRRQYLIGNTNVSPKKSVSTVDIGDRFKSFMDKISNTQKMLNPAPQPSPAMQAFLNSNIVPLSSRPGENVLSLANTPHISNEHVSEKPLLGKAIEVGEESSDSSKSDEGKVFVFPTAEPSDAKRDRKIVDTSIPLDNNEPIPNCDNIKTQPSPPELIDNNKTIMKLDFEANTQISLPRSDALHDAKNTEILNLFKNKSEQLSVGLDNTNLGELLEIDVVEAVNCEIVESDVSPVVNEIPAAENTLPPHKIYTEHMDEISGTESDIDKIFEELANEAINEMEDLSQSERLLNGSTKSHSNDTSFLHNLGDPSGLKEGFKNKTPIVNVKPINFTHSFPVQIDKFSILNREESFRNKARMDHEDIPEIKEIVQLPCFENIIDRLDVDVQSPLARISSLESIEDSETEDISDKMEPTLSSKADSEVPANMIEFMDVSDGEESSLDETGSPPIAYNVLEEDTPTAPIAPLEEFLKSRELEAKTIAANPIISKADDKPKEWKLEFKSKSLDQEETTKCDSTLRSFSEPPSIEESSEKKGDFKDTPKRYEGCIPRFKDRGTPFRYLRDSIDVRKSYSSKPLFTPSREDILQREKNESALKLSLSTSNISFSNPTSPDVDENLSTSPNSSFSDKFSPVRSGRYNQIVKPKDGDLVRDMVMSRITRRSPDKTTRRNSRNSVYPLSGSDSKTSLCDSRSSLERSISIEDAGSKKEGIVTSPLRENPVANAGLPYSRGSIKENEVDVNRSWTNKRCSTPVKEEDAIPRSSLPATPMTHPEKFDNSVHYRSSMLRIRKPTPEALTGVSDRIIHPRPVSMGAIDSLHLRSFVDNRPQPFGRHTARTSSQFPSTLPATPNEPPIFGTEVSKGRAKIDKNERLKELLAEHRRKEPDIPKDKFIDKDKESCIKGCLEEYRQKRSSEPLPTASSKIAPKQPSMEAKYVENPQSNSRATSQHFHRPSLLELESMQVFTSSPERHFQSVAAANVVPLSSVSYSSGVEPGHELSKSASAVNVEGAEKKVKKSRDRERRRSLIQVFAGMFKSEEKKKPAEDSPTKSAVSKSSPNVSIPASPPELSPQDTPKSPSVRQRFSKLRLTRPKEKSKERKNRSSSAGNVEDLTMNRSELRQPVEAVSLPTSPSRTLFSFLSSTRINEKNPCGPRLSSPFNSSQNSRMYDTPCIKEENLSDDETGSARNTPDRDHVNNQTPSLRRQKATLRAAKQAEHKRLRMAQEIQRQLQEWEVQTKDLEEKGIFVEKTLRGETNGSPKEEADLMKDWFSLVHDKNALSRWGRELSVKARELELEDRHVRLENELRQRMSFLESKKTREDINREGVILADMLTVLEEKESLAAQFEEDKRRCDCNLCSSNTSIDHHSDFQNERSLTYTIPTTRYLESIANLFSTLHFTEEDNLYWDSSPFCRNILLRYCSNSVAASTAVISHKPSVFDQCICDIIKKGSCVSSEMCSFSHWHVEKAKRVSNAAENGVASSNKSSLALELLAMILCMVLFLPSLISCLCSVIEVKYISLQPF